MDQVEKGSGAAPEDGSGTFTTEPDSITSGTSDKQFVRRETHSRAVTEAKRFKEEAREKANQLDDALAKLSEIENANLQQQGKFKELAERESKEKQELKQKLNTAVANFARGKAMDVIVDEAVKMGVTSTKLLKKCVEDELETLDYDNEFNPNRDQVKEMLERLRTEESVLFNTAKPNVANHVIRTGNMTSKALDTDNMSKDELLAAVKKYDSLI